MNKLVVKSRQILSTFSNLEKKHKVLTYASLLFLTISTYFLRSENETVKIKYATIQEKNQNLKHDLVIYNRSFESFPLPIWQKVKRGNKFVMIYLNPAFLKTIGHNYNYDEYEIMGKDNFELFPEKIAQHFYENDVAVSITGDTLNFIENFMNKEGKKIKTKVIKWRNIKDGKDTLVFGMIKEILPFKKNIKVASK